MRRDSITTRYCLRCFRDKPTEELGKRQGYCKPCTREYNRLTRNPYKQRASQIKRRYGISIEHYENMAWDQNGHCAICGEVPGPIRGRRLHVDHDHKTGRVRALLCLNCNVGLGNFMDDPARLEKARDYVMQFRNHS